MAEDCFHASFVEPFLLCVWFVWADDGELPPYEGLWAEQVPQTVGTEHRGWGRCRGGTAVGIVWGARPDGGRMHGGGGGAPCAGPIALSAGPAVSLDFRVQVDGM